jgi:hypothetical protein
LDRAIRHPASGYVQGINDLVTPFLAVFLSEILEGDMEQWASDSLSPETLYIVEADCYWCLCKLLDGIQVNVEWDFSFFNFGRLLNLCFVERV